MVRYFPHANPAFHPNYPHLLDFAPANVSFTVLGISGSGGIVIGLARYVLNDVFNRKTRGLCLRSVAIGAVICVPLSALISTIQVRQAAQSGSLEYKKRVYLTNFDKIDVDDWCICGALLGAAMAMVPVRRPGVVGWKRYLGAASMGSLGGQSVYKMKHNKEYVRAAELQEEYVDKRRKPPEGPEGGIGHYFSEPYER